jgi:hypothetical protein
MDLVKKIEKRDELLYGPKQPCCGLFLKWCTCKDAHGILLKYKKVHTILNTKPRC